MHKINQKLRDFVFKGLLFEADSEIFRKAGLNVGIDFSKNEEKLLLENLEKFNIQTRNNALHMTKLYALLNCFENQIRDLIRETLSEKDVDWFEKLVPKKVKDFANTRMEDDKKNSWLEGAPTDFLGFVNFGHLSDIMCENWDLFKAIIPSQHWLKQRMDELEKSRNYIAHNRLLLDSEFERIYMYIDDWNKQVGF